MAFFSNFKKSALELKSVRCITVTAMMIALNLALKSVTVYVTDDLKISFSFLALAAIGMLFGPTVGFLSGAVTDILGLLIAQNIGAFNPLFTLVEAVGGMLYGIFLYNLKPIKFSKESLMPNADRSTLLLSSINAKIAAALIIAAVFLLKSMFEIHDLLVIYTVIIALAYGFLLYRLALLPWKQLFRVIGAKLTVAVVCNIVLTPLCMLITEVWTWDAFVAVKLPARLLKNAIQVPVDCVLLFMILFPIAVAYNRIFKNRSIASGNKKKTAEEK